jgi:putative ABC transport system permease protein
LTTLQVRTDGNPKAMLTAVTREVHALDANMPVFNAGLLADQLRNSLSPQRSVVTLIGTLGLLALTLASVGLYGVMAYTVSQNTREIGIRMALGATRQNVVRMVLRQGVVLALAGVVIGLALSFALAKVIASLLFDVRPTDWISFSVATLVLLGAAILASYIPARRATRVDPLDALRYE